MTTNSDAAAWQGLADHAIAQGKMTEAQKVAGFASDLASQLRSEIEAEQAGQPDRDAAFRALGEHAVASGKMTRAQLEAGLADDLESEVAGLAPRDERGRFAGTRPEKTESSDLRAARAMLDGLVKAGRLTQAEHDQHLARAQNELETGKEGAPLESAKPADPLGKLDVDPAIDRPSDPSGYKFPQAKSESLDVPTMQAISQLAWQARLNQPTASEVFNIADEYSAKTFSDAEYQLLTQQTTAKVNAKYGAETPAKLDQARRFVTAVMKENPALLPLIGTGLGSDYRFVVRMIEHASMLYGAPQK